MKHNKKHNKKHTKKYTKQHTKKHTKKHTKVNLNSKINIKLYKNGSGTRLLVMPNRKETESSSIYFYFKVGSKNETPDINGISHFIEHMLFKGSSKFPNYLDISKTFDSNGISFNAYTSKDTTAYHYKFLSTPENLDLICKITSEMLFKSLMRKKDIGPERNVIIQEYNDGIDDIDEYISDKLEECVFKGHPLAMPIIGTLDTLHKINRDKIMEYYHKHYTPDNLLIGFTGDKKGSLLDNFSSVISGPPNILKYSDDERYLLASACRAHECSSKGLIWIDTKEKKSIGLIRHAFWNTLTDYKKNQFLLFSKDYEEIPLEFVNSVKNWIKSEEITSPSIVRMIDSDSEIKVLNKDIFN